MSRELLTAPSLSHAEQASCLDLFLDKSASIRPLPFAEGAPSGRVRQFGHQCWEIWTIERRRRALNPLRCASSIAPSRSSGPIDTDDRECRLSASVDDRESS